MPGRIIYCILYYILYIIYYFRKKEAEASKVGYYRFDLSSVARDADELTAAVQCAAGVAGRSPVLEDLEHMGKGLGPIPHDDATVEEIRLEKGMRIEVHSLVSLLYCTYMIPHFYRIVNT